MDVRKLKEKASEAFAKGKFAKAAELYADYCEQDKKDTQARLRMGDAFAKSGEKTRAIKAYRSAAEDYAKEGFLPRAIAASKLILELDPSHTGMQQLLADLYAKRTGSAPVSKPAPKAHVRPREIELPPDDSAPKRVEEIELSLVSAPPPERPRRVTGGSEPSAPPGGNLGSGSRLPAELELEVETVENKAETEEALELTLEAAHEEIEPAEDLIVEGISPPRPGVAQPIGATEVAAHVEALNPTPTDVVLLDRPKTPPPPVSRVFAPQPFTPLPPIAPAPVAPSVQTSESGTAPTAASPSPPASGDLMSALSKFDELDVDLSASLGSPPIGGPTAPSGAGPPGLTPRPPSSPAASASSVAPPAAPSAATPPGMTRKAKLPSFTELELEGDSLLHAVELAAQAGGGSASDEGFSIGSELVDEPAGPGALPKIPLFSDLPPDAFIELFDRCPLRRFTTGERIFEQGSQGDSFFVVCAGKVSIFRMEGASRQNVAELDEGAFFGEMALLSGAPRTANVEAVAEDTQLLEISAQLLAELSAKHPTVAQALKKFCRQRMLTNVMSSSALFRPFNKKERRALVERFRSRDVPKGTALVREGEQSDGLYIVLSGEVEVTASGQTLAKLKEADVFGEMSLLNRSPAGASVSTTKKTSLLRLPRADFEQLISTHPQILALVSELTDDRRRQNEAVLSGAAAMGDEGLLLV